MSKCDLCRTRQAMGMAPACVEICPAGPSTSSPGRSQALATPEYEAAHRKVMEHVRPVIAPCPAGEVRPGRFFPRCVPAGFVSFIHYFK